MLGDTQFQRQIQLPAHPHFTSLPTVDPLFQIRALVGKLRSCAPAHGRPQSCAPAHGRPRSHVLTSIYSAHGRERSILFITLFPYLYYPLILSLFVLSPYPFPIWVFPLFIYFPLTPYWGLYSFSH